MMLEKRRIEYVGSESDLTCACAINLGQVADVEPGLKGHFV